MATLKKKKPDTTVKMSMGPHEVELTQKIDLDYEKILDAKKKQALLARIKDEQTKAEKTTSSHIGKTVFSKKRIADDYVKSNSIIYTINSIPPLENKLELQDICSNYELKEQFSEGAQGVISTAFDKSLKRDIVVKSIKGDDTEEHAQRAENLFVSEARIMAQLDHPSIVPLYGLLSGEASKLHLAMKHIHGKTLQEYLLDTIDLYENEGVDYFDEKRSITTRIEYLIKVCEAIDYAHCKGVIHRDIKSENIMIGNYGEVYVMDWGLACLMRNDKPSSGKKNKKVKKGFVGTPCYIAPELIMGGTATRQSDIFALGMVFFEIITLQRAVGGQSVKEVLRNVMDQNYCPFKHRFGKIKLSKDLEAIFEKATAPYASQRYKTVSDMAEDLKLYLMHEETIARPDNVLRKSIRSMINHKMITSIVILSILLGFASITIYSLYTQNILVKKQKERENMLASFQYDVSRKAADINEIFGHFKSQLANLAFTAGSLLSKPTVMSPPIFDMKYYKQKSTAPLDYVYSPAYDRKISLNYTAFKLDDSVKANNYIIRRIIPIWPNLIQALFKGDRSLKGKSINQSKEIIMNKGITLSWVYIGLENGSMLCYPGGNIDVKDFDPRKLTWYKNSLKQKHNLVWSEPYISAFNSKLVMTCSRCIFSLPERLRGVAGMDVNLDYIQKQVFTAGKNSGAKEYLLTKDGRVIISSDFNDKKFKLKKNTALTLKRFPFNEEFQKALKQKRVLFEVQKNNTKYIFVLNKLSSMKYYYLRQISTHKLRDFYKKK